MKVRTIVWGGMGLAALGFASWLYRMPALHTTPSGTQVTGCDGERDESTASVCPRLLCQKAVREHSVIGDRADIELTHSFTIADGNESVHAGTARWTENDETKQSYVRCIMHGDEIMKAGPVTADEFNAIVYENKRLQPTLGDPRAAEAIRSAS
jgi:hypothetical protein